MKKAAILATLIAITAMPVFAGDLYANYNGDWIICVQREGFSACLSDLIFGK